MAGIPEEVACDNIDILLIKRDAAWLSSVEPRIVASEKTLTRQSLAFDSMTEKSSLAFWALVRGALAGALVFLVEAFVTGTLDSSALLGDLSDGSEIVDSGRTQYTA